MNKEELIDAIDDLWNSYDAFYFENKYTENNTHKKEFELLFKYFENDEIALKTINWIKYSYDCYYKEDFKEELNGCKNAFAYLKSKLGENEK